MTNGSAPIAATVMVLTRNSAESLPAALASVRDFAEVIVCDGQSTDETVAIARRSAARVIEQDSAFIDPDGRLRDYAGVRHQVVREASQQWIFHLDADEMATPALTEAIREIVDDDDSAAGYKCTARHVVGDAVIRSAANYPMRFLRIFRRDAVEGYAGPINEHPEFADNATIEQIDAHFLIPMPPLRSVLRKWARYQRIILRSSRGQGVRRWWAGDGSDYRRLVKWLSWRTIKTRRCEPGPHLPLRYDIARVGFHVAGFVASGVGAVMPRRGTCR